MRHTTTDADLREHLPAGRVGGVWSTSEDGAPVVEEILQRMVEASLRVAREEGYPKLLIQLWALPESEKGPRW